MDEPSWVACSASEASMSPVAPPLASDTTASMSPVDDASGEPVIATLNPDPPHAESKVPSATAPEMN
jgi:hypothetical protein